MCALCIGSSNERTIVPRTVIFFKSVGEVNEAKKGKFKNLPEEENPAIAELVHPHTLLDILVPIVPLFNQMHIDTDFLAPDVVDDNELDVDHVNPIEDTFKGLDEDITFKRKDCLR